ncbi:hypothetical protein [Microbispora sp. NBC_01389]|uniref:hypothetical protein n=1 Tax=Microbispora sp. NBC_01389 TaxID=2903584 RepID=UPI00324864CA
MENAGSLFRLPSPVEELIDPRLEARGIRLLLKRDDLIDPEIPGKNLNYHFGGYAKTKPELLSFIEDFEKRHGLRPDRLYTGKMMYGIFDLVEKHRFPPAPRSSQSSPARSDTRNSSLCRFRPTTRKPEVIARVDPTNAHDDVRDLLTGWRGDTTCRTVKVCRP